MSIRIFEGTNHANIYAKFRPIVPNSVIENVLNFLNEKIEKKDWNIAVDVGCGSGQGTNELSKYFKQCYGFDVSKAQINEAKLSDHPKNTEFNVSPAESMPIIKSNSVQLLTACEAAHWFNLENFFKESDRILVDNGVIATIGYFLPEPINLSKPEDKRLYDLVLEIYNDPNLAPYKNPNIISIEKRYHDFKFPKNYEYVHKDYIVDSFETYATALVGMIESWSLFQGLVSNDRYLADKRLENFKQKVKDILKTDDLANEKIVIKYTYFIAMGRKIA